MMSVGKAQKSRVALSFDGVSMEFHPRDREPIRALEDVNFTVGQGEFVCVVGASGSGKSTLLRLVAGLLQPTGGSVSLNDEPVTGPGLDRAMVFQSDALLPWSTVLDNAAYGLRMAKVSKQEARAAALERLRLVGLEGYAAAFPHELSGGMRQRVNIARALTVDPEVILLDEPFAALDAQTRELMSAELLRIWSVDKKTVLFITHQLDEAVYLADRVVVLAAHPGAVREIVDVPFERPRDLSVKRSRDFGKIVEHIWGLIEDEVTSSFRK